jgi:hypothetical protein
MTRGDEPSRVAHPELKTRAGSAEPALDEMGLRVA